MCFIEKIYQLGKNYLELSIKLNNFILMLCSVGQQLFDIKYVHVTLCPSASPS